ncbi:hypothetical protein [Planosporangium mesophilum]|uniref:Uncharacterized protein n=1 Tax=Planosporangium mesophilum TaxID=689768 RepID=A0A8J3TBU4_9ACTN|nr:hypothetical protein [Planosporangium mesophilum]NJC83058.1 hypothetical protein [Planosporangium mesophilum]GII22466.1 hypothetical protein Pme01_20630 [Planosporangium mesophilum]
MAPDEPAAELTPAPPASAHASSVSPQASQPPPVPPAVAESRVANEAADPVDRVLARARALTATRSQRVRLGLGGGALALLALVGFVSCEAGAPGDATARPAFSAAAEPPDPVAVLTPGPAPTTDGCHGAVTAAQASKAAGFPVTAAGGDAAAAVRVYAQAARGQGLDATVQLCPFSGAGGDQVYVMTMTFPNTAQAERMYAGTGAGQVAAKPVTGVGDAATSDGAQTLLARRGRSLVLVYLVRPADPRGDHSGALRALALAALGKA